MSEYKRLTEKIIGYFEYDLKDFKHKLGDFNDYDAFFSYSMVVKRLGELEDKIENGTLVTVPYAIGQEVYWVDKKGYFDVEKVKVSLITIRHDGSVDIRLNHYNDDGSYRSCFKYDPKYYELFDNEVDAKKRLEEIRNETKSIDSSGK